MHRSAPIATRLLALLAIPGALFFFAHAQQDGRMRLPELDLETLEAETPDGTFQAQRAEDAFVGEIADGRAIGIAFASEVDIPADEDEIVVRLYDRQRAAVMVGSIDDQGNALLRSMEGSDFDATVALTLHDDAVTGTVTYAGLMSGSIDSRRGELNAFSTIDSAAPVRSTARPTGDFATVSMTLAIAGCSLMPLVQS